MKIWKTLIVDDEPLARFEIKRLLGSYQQISIVAEADSVPSAKKSIELLNPDLLFLDINLGTHSGFDLLELTEQNFQTIFVTAYDKYAIRAFEINALDYLLKPVHPDRLKESINRLGSPYKEDKKINLKPFDKILVSNQNCSKFITVSSIMYIEANGDYTKVFVNTGFKGHVHQTIKKWIERLPAKVFLQVHRSYIVNINLVNKIQKKPTGTYTTLLDNLEIPISRKYLKKVKEKFSVV
jgi:two-component system LytT family response regulator